MSLAQFSITPTLDFELDASIQQLDAVSTALPKRKSVGIRFVPVQNLYAEESIALYRKQKN